MQIARLTLFLLITLILSPIILPGVLVGLIYAALRVGYTLGYQYTAFALVHGARRPKVEQTPLGVAAGMRRRNRHH